MFVVQTYLGRNLNLVGYVTSLMVII